MNRFFFASVLTLMACGNSQPTPAAPPATTPAPASTTAPKGRLGHYSSGDGMVGFVLDRTGDPPKMKLDGSSDVIVLTVRRTSKTSWDLVNVDAHVGISVDTDGNVLFSKKGAGPNREMTRDADAQPL